MVTIRNYLNIDKSFRKIIDWKNKFYQDPLKTFRLAEIVESLGLESLSGPFDLHRQVSGVCVSDMLSDVMANIPRDAIWITNQIHENVVAIAYFRHLAAVILTEQHRPEATIIDTAQQKGVSVFTTDGCAYEVAGRLWELGLRAPCSGGSG